jgi:hypothetical protein
VVYIFIAVSFALAGGLIGRIKGSSFWIWFLIAGLIPFIGLACAVLYRTEDEELRRECPSCGKVVKLHDALCTRCGAELEFPEDPDEILASVAAVDRAQRAG